MMLLDSFFNIVTEKIDENQAEFTIRLNPEHSIFLGHFPMYPITPGVCITQMTVDLFSHIQNETYHLQKARNIKFLNIIKPQETPQLTYQLSWEETEENSFRIKALVCFQDQIYAKLDFELTK